MKKSDIANSTKLRQTSKTDWKRVVSQKDAEIVRNANSDSDSPILSNKKYYKPAKSEQ